MESNVLQKRWVQGSNVVVDDLHGTAFTGEAGAHTFQISGVDSAQETVAITGTITGRFLTATNVTVPLTGSISDGVASVTLTEDCYVIPGRFVLSIYATNGSTTQCIYCGVGNVFRTQSDIIEYPSASIPDIEQIIADAQAAVTEINADVAAAQAAVAAAQTAVDGIEDQRQTMIASIASVAGQGTDTTLTQSGVAADAKATGDQVRDLKSAFDANKGQTLLSNYLTIPRTVTSGANILRFGRSMPTGKTYAVRVTTKSTIDQTARAAISTGTSSVVQEDVAVFDYSKIMAGEWLWFRARNTFDGLRMWASPTGAVFNVEFAQIAEIGGELSALISKSVANSKIVNADELKWSMSNADGTYNQWLASSEMIPLRYGENVLFKFSNDRTLGNAISYFDRDGNIISGLTTTTTAEYEHLVDRDYISDNGIGFAVVSIFYNTAPSGATFFPTYLAAESGMKIVRNPEWFDYGYTFNNPSLTFEQGNIANGKNQASNNNIRTTDYIDFKGTDITLRAGAHNLFIALYSSHDVAGYLGAFGIASNMIRHTTLEELGCTTATCFRVCMWSSQSATVIPVSYGATYEWGVSIGNYNNSNPLKFNNPVIYANRADTTVWDGGDGWYYNWCTSAIDNSNAEAFTIYKSTNCVDWIDTGVHPFDDTTSAQIIAWANERYNTTVTHFYAPTVYKANGKYYLYVSIQQYGTISAVSDNPCGPFDWNGEAVVDGSITGLGVTYEDAFVAKEINSETHYIFFGSHGYVYRAELASDLRHLIENPVYTRVAGNINGSEASIGNRGEGAMLFWNDGWWYLFFSKGSWNSRSMPYHVLVGRSKTLDGEFVDKTGTALTADNGGTLILSTDGSSSLWGPGHNAEIITGKDNRTYMFYSRYDRTLQYRHMWLQEIYWDSDNWPYFGNNGHPIVQGNIRPFGA